MDILGQIKLWLSQMYLYVLGGAVVVIALMGLLLYINGLRLSKARADLGNAKMALSVSNDSVKSLTTELSRLDLVLKENARVEKVLQDKISGQIKAQDKKDQSLKDLEKRLRERPVTLNCTIPKDLQEAWNKL